jgi:hypothetical protein
METHDPGHGDHPLFEFPEGRGLRPALIAATFSGMMLKKFFAILAVLLAISGTPTMASAQEAAAGPRPESWAAVVDLAFSGASGNDQTVLLTSDFRLSHLRTERFELEWSGSVRYGRSEGREVARNLKSGLKLDLLPEARWSPFALVTAERDPFRKLDLRSNSGAGVKYSFWRAPKGAASISVAALHSYEDFISTATDPLDPRQSARWSWRFKGERELGPRVRIENVSFYQPVWNRSAEYQLTMESALRVPMSDRIALSLVHAYDRDSMAPEGVKRDNHLLKAGLTIETRW